MTSRRTLLKALAVASIIPSAGLRMVQGRRDYRAETLARLHAIQQFMRGDADFEEHPYPITGRAIRALMDEAGHAAANSHS